MVSMACALQLTVGPPRVPSAAWCISSCSRAARCAGRPTPSVACEAQLGMMLPRDPGVTIWKGSGGAAGQGRHICYDSCTRTATRCAGRPTPSVACVVQPGVSGGFQKVFFGREEIAIPLRSRSASQTCACVSWRGYPGSVVCSYYACQPGSRASEHSTTLVQSPADGVCPVCSTPEAVAAYPRADVFINFASFRR